MLLIFAVTSVEFNEKIGGRTIDHEKELELNAIYNLTVINQQINYSLCILMCSCPRKMGPPKKEEKLFYPFLPLPTA